MEINKFEGVEIIVPDEDISDVELGDYNLQGHSQELPPGEGGISPLKVFNFRTSESETGGRKTTRTYMTNFCFHLIRKMKQFLTFFSGTIWAIIYCF